MSEINVLAGVKVVGLSTELKVLSVLKGESPKRPVLHHYRAANKDQPMNNGPNLIAFDSAGLNSYLFFLVREARGQFAPVTGQTDPARFSVLKLEGDAR